MAALESRRAHAHGTDLFGPKEWIMKISLCFVVVVKLISSQPQNGRRTLIRKGDIMRSLYKGALGSE